VLLDALEALKPHLDAIVVIGAQAIYLHTGGADVALAETTKDSDIALDTRVLTGAPKLEDAMRQAGFVLDPSSAQPGSWQSPDGIPVDLMVPESLAGAGGDAAPAFRRTPSTPRVVQSASRLPSLTTRRCASPRSIPGTGVSAPSTSRVQPRSWSPSCTRSRSEQARLAASSTRTPTMFTVFLLRSRRTNSLPLSDT
jgi:hypothetical protein